MSHRGLLLLIADDWSPLAHCYGNDDVQTPRIDEFAQQATVFHRAYCTTPSCAASRAKGRLWHPGPFNFANGVALMPDQSAVVVCCTWLPGVERIGIRADGSAGKREVYAKLPPKTLPDGAAFDAKGRLHVGCYAPSCIYTIAPGRTRGQRTVSLLIDDWEMHTLCNPTNLAFGGPNLKHLFTANLGRWHLTRIGLNTAGRRLPSHH